MKKIIYACLVLASLLVSAPAKAQAIANLGFETWATRNGADAPANWQNSDDYLLAFLQLLGYPGGPIPVGAVTKTTTAHGGTYAANLTTQSVALLSGAAFPGIAVLGSKLGPNLIGGAPYTARPTQLQFYYQYTGPVADSATAVVYVTNTVGGQANPLGQGLQILAPTTGAYTLASVPITYTSSAAPDSVRIIFISGNARTPTVGSSLKVDDVALVGTALATRADAALQEKLTVSPNPSSDGRFQLSAPDAPALTSAALTVLDLTGRVVRRQPALPVPSPSRELDLNGLRAGIYLLRVDSKDGALVRQLTIK
jgi:hypothetical protein